MNTIIIAVGKLKNRNLAQEVEDLLKRLRHVSIIEIKDSNKEQEGKEILEKMKDNAFVIACSEEGTQYPSVTFSHIVQKLKLEKNIIFVIGGPDGLSEAVKNTADEVLSLSKMTFTHEIARLLLVEQLYRADAISSGKTYHRQ